MGLKVTKKQKLDESWAYCKREFVKAFQLRKEARNRWDNEVIPAMTKVEKMLVVKCVTAEYSAAVAWRDAKKWYHGQLLAQAFVIEQTALAFWFGRISWHSKFAKVVMVERSHHIGRSCIVTLTNGKKWTFEAQRIPKEA